MDDIRGYNESRLGRLYLKPYFASIMAVKGASRILSLALLLTGARMGFAQAFTNLDFEDATIVQGLSPLPNQIVASNAIPGWTTYTAGQARTLITLGGAINGGGIELIRTNGGSVVSQPVEPAQGDYSIILRQVDFGGLETNHTSAIGQMGMIPLSTESLTFWGNFNGRVSFDGQTLAYSIIGKAGTYNIYGVNISAFAGDTGELLFSTASNPIDPTTGGLIDNIQFSSLPVPEPGEMALLAAGILFLRFVRKPSN